MELDEAVDVDVSEAVAVMEALALADEVPVPVAGVRVLEALAPRDSDAVAV